EYIAVPLDENGLPPDALEAAMRSGPKFVYALPNFQNPCGITWSEERRKKLLEIADHYGVPVLEDDPYGQLRYEGDHIPPLVALDAKLQANNGAPYTGNVIYLSTFSKTLAPGLRLAWVIAPNDVIKKLVQAKQGTDLHASTLSQMLAYEVLQNDFLPAHVKRIRALYGERRDAMLKALEAFFPAGVSWTRPQGGLFLWLTFPEWLDAADLLKEAVKEKVAFVPGVSFHSDGGGKNTARLNFSFCNPEKIEEGIRRLGYVLERVIAERGAGAAV
ncbi:MAG: PLP-dependent aminotransferase family protein, partial [Acidobacteria bacterium]